MALWQFDVRIEPRAALAEATGDIPLTISEHEYLNKDNDWSAYISLGGLEETLPQFLKVRKTWSADLKGWGEEDGDRVDIFYVNGLPESWSMRFDMRSPNHAFIIKMIDLVAEYDGVFVTQDRYVVVPSYLKVLDHMRRSNSFKFVQNPRKFIEEMGLRDKHKE